MPTEGSSSTSTGAPPGELSSRVSPFLGPLGVTVCVAVGTHFAFSLDRAGTIWFWALSIVPSAVIAALGLFRAHRDGELRDWIKFVWGDPTRGIVSAAILVGASLVFVHAVTPVGSPRESWLARLYLQFGSPTVLRENAPFVGAAIVLAASSEEIVWRGLVTRQLAEAIGSRTAWVWAAVLYAAAHVPTIYRLSDPVAGTNPVLVVAALVLGIVWGAMVRVFGRLMPAILSHIAFDWCVLMMFRLWGPGV